MVVTAITTHSYCNYICCIQYKHSLNLTAVFFSVLASANLAPSEAGTIITGVEGRNVILSFQASCAVFYLSEDSFQWLFSKMNLTKTGSSLEIAGNSNTRYEFSSDMLSLTISNLSTADAGYYTLMVTTSMTVLQATIHLAVQGKCWWLHKHTKSNFLFLRISKTWLLMCDVHCLTL